MKHQFIKWTCMAALLVTVSCVDDDPLRFSVDKPESLAVSEYLNSYDVLKSYVDRTENPGFKLGVGATVSTFNAKGVEYRLICANFDEMTAGYAMKHGAVVQSDGSLGLGSVTSFLQNAEAAGISVFGHTLCWHANQNATYLNSLIETEIIPGTSEPTWDLVTGADFETDAASNYQYSTNAIAAFTEEGEGANGEGRALKITNGEVRTNDYDVQFFLTFSPAMVAGEQYELSMDVRADAAASFGTQAHVVPYTYKYWDFFGSISATTEWTTFTKQITVTDDMATAGAIAFNLGKNATTYYFDNVTLKKYNASGSGSAGYAYTFTNPSVTNYWSAQIAYDMAALDNNTEYTLKFVVKANTTGSIRAELQSTSDYSSNSFGSFAVTKEWKEYELTTTTTKADRNRFVISFGDFAGTVYIDNVSLIPSGGSTSIITNGDFESGTDGWGGWGNDSSRGRSAEGEGYGGTGDQVIEKTDEEKREIIGNALEAWIAGMLEACKGYVKAWDVVNEPMSDWPDPSQLKSGAGDSEIASDEFYWQDYLGKDYAVYAIRYARQYGNPGDMLFINDYGLESSDQKKCEGLIKYVEYVESQGVVVDGIGTQMHVTLGETTMEGIRAMLTNLAATGKLVKISELDMGIKPEGSSENLTTSELTDEQHREMARFYSEIIEAYFELVPAAQRYGITQWAVTDSPENSSWRAGQPIGLWTESYSRKHAYAGFANGFAGKEVVEGL
ncbi:MAG: endo-1,4-beta-xylanase [Breznakibacter sp.]